MKKWCTLIFVLLLFSLSAYAQTTVTTAEMKTVLIDAIKDYLQSQTPRLEKDELKDLIVAYLTTSGDTVDLSKTGTYSGEKLTDIYNKAKGISPIQIPADAFNLDTYTGSTCYIVGFCYASAPSYAFMNCGDKKSNYYIFTFDPEKQALDIRPYGWHLSNAGGVTDDSGADITLTHIETGKEWKAPYMTAQGRLGMLNVNSAEAPSGKYLINLTMPDHLCNYPSYTSNYYGYKYALQVI